MNERIKEQVDQVEPNLQKLKHEIDLYLAALHYFNDKDPETAEWKFEAVKLINVILDWYRSRVEDWTTQIINGVKIIETFPHEFINLINILNMTPKPDEGKTDGK